MSEAKKPKKVAILTNFVNFNPGYSLTGIVFDQALMLQAHGWEVHLYTNENFGSDNASFDPANPAGDGFNPFEVDIDYEKKFPVHIHHKIPLAHLKDYRSVNDVSEEHLEYVKKLQAFLIEELADFDIAFTHDWIFTGWNLPYALALQGISDHLPDIRWMHWIHSIPTAHSDWWDIRRYGGKHRIIYPNKHDAMFAVENYHAKISDVVVIPHIKDMRTFWDFHEDTRKFIDDFPGVMQSDIVCIYPASTDRLHAKKLDYVIKILAEVKKRGFTVFFACANQWATKRNHGENIESYYKMAHRNGLRRGEDFVFTSDWIPKYASGLSKRILRELYLCANVFIFPTNEETFGLVAPEAGISGAKLMMLNKSLGNQLEINGFCGIYANFGSFHNHFQPADESVYVRDLAYILISRIRDSEAVVGSTFYRTSYNYDAIYRKYYGPTMGSAMLWGN